MPDWTSNATLMMDDISWTNSNNLTNDTSANSVDLPRTVSLIFIFAVSLVGNVCTVAVVSSFKQHKLPDVLVIGLACTDLIATFIPIPMSLFSYISLKQFDEGSVACNFYGTVAQFTRYASVLIVTLISLERYFAVNQPFIYRKHATPRKCISVLICCWIIALALAVIPALDSSTPIRSHDGFCLFDFTTNYAISVLIYAAVQFCIVLLCFILVTGKLLRVYRRRKQLQVQGTYNQRSQAREREHEVTFTRPKLTSRISDIGIAIKKAAPIITEKFQLGVEAQFARMLFAVVALFYVSWTTLLILITIAQVNQKEGQSLALFWGIRLSVISLAVNPILYGLLARQYRMAYLYVIRRIFSWCCWRCVEPPVKNVFATARTPGGDSRQVALQRRLREKNYGSQSNRSMNGSVVLTRTTHVSLDLLPQLEEEYMSQEESVYDHSTYIPSVGELSSTVIIPQQIRDNYDGSTLHVQQQPRTTSELNLIDTFNDQSPMVQHPGSRNPLAIVADIQGESTITEHSRSKRRFPPLEAIDPDDLNTGKVYNNPVYDMEKKRKEEKSLELSQSSAVSLLKRSHKTKIKTATPKDDITPKLSEDEPSVLTPTKKPIEIARSSPLTFLRGSKKRQKIRTSLAMPATLHPGDEKQSVITSIDDVENCKQLTLTATGNKRPFNVARASARMYNEKMRNSTTTHQISSSRSFVDYPHITGTSVGVKREDCSNDSAIGLAPRYQLSVSPTPPPSHDIVNPERSSECPSDPMNVPHTGTSVNTNQSIVSKPSLSTPTAVFSTSNVRKRSPTVKSSQTNFQSHKSITHVPLNSSVKELRLRFESLSSTPPTSPTSLTSHTHSTDADLDSGRESMVELVVTDI